MSLIKNSGWNIFGLAVPLLMAIPVMGILARLLGVERFGLFTIAYALMGYASVFDGGLSRAVIRFVSTYRNDEKRVNAILGTSLYAVAGLSIFIVLLAYFFAPSLAKFLNVSPEYYNELALSLRLLGLCVPALLLTQVWRAYLEGVEKFSSLNIQQVTTSPFIILLPLFAVLYSPTLTSAVVGLVVGRWIVAILTWKICAKHIKRFRRNFRKDVFTELMTFGGWVTLSNIIGPLMGFVDRFAVSHLSGASVVAHYSGPSDMVSRLALFPGAVARALFPKLSYSNLKDSHSVYSRTLWSVLIFSIFLATPFFIFSSEILGLWLGREYMGDAAQIFKILLLGFVFNSVAQICFAKIQSAGHAKWTGLIHIIEFFPYLAVLYYLTTTYSIYGAAVAFFLRSFADFLILFYVEKIGIRMKAGS
ncbi:flippase [Enterobacter hormaechei]|uniref:flippase n=1 Tax=Enterobacter hormaechei TaxID=158836 RepID=UPI000F82F4EB|nr:flippase [Enterobacter hormaechei]MEA3818371.1 flippase [Enterobacter hormaechei]RTN56184.1 flippase [Enterobacter hormaechei]VAC28296.1 MATE efflux family protein [Enterobacter hormaechei]VAF71751.1 MATE efflux family protein [Enterobacter hormaechei]HCU2526850.1 flippase [Enterobacter hormaechei]